MFADDTNLRRKMQSEEDEKILREEYLYRSKDWS